MSSLGIPGYKSRLKLFAILFWRYRRCKQRRRWHWWLQFAVEEWSSVWSMMCGLGSWCVGWNCDVWFSRLLEIWDHVCDSFLVKTLSALCSHIHPINPTKSGNVKMDEGKGGEANSWLCVWDESILIQSCWRKWCRDWKAKSSVYVTYLTGFNRQWAPKDQIWAEFCYCPTPNEKGNREGN